MTIKTNHILEASKNKFLTNYVRERNNIHKSTERKNVTFRIAFY